MPLTFGGKRKPGGTGPRVPLDPQESALADRLEFILNGLSGEVPEKSIREAIIELAPDLLEYVLEQVDIERLTGMLFDSLRSIIMSGGTSEAKAIMRSAPRIQPVAGDALQYGGQVLPSGIIMPTAQVPELPDVEFVIESPVDRMFRSINVRATDYARLRSGQLITQINESNRLAIRQQITRAFTGPVPQTVDQTARNVRSIVGLHPRWANAVIKFEDANYRSFIKDGLSEEQARARAAELAAGYKDKLIRRRAEMIARTEIQMAGNYARQASWDGLSRSGLVDPRAEKEWRTAPLGSSYGPPCEECKSMRGKRVPWNGTFPNGYMYPPAHPHCRCTVVLVPPTRGLSGLPSQDMGPWIDELDRLDRESIADFAKSETVLKHGSHNQKTHGRKDSRNLPTGWSQKNSEERIQEFMSQARSDWAANTPEERLRELATASISASDVYEGPRGTKVAVSSTAELSDAQIDAQLSAVTTLQSIAPVQGLTVSIGDEAFAQRGLPESIKGFTPLGSDEIYLRSSAVSTGVSFESGALMPVFGTNPQLYSVVHEYGHVLDKRSPETADKDFTEVVSGPSQQGMSRYAYSGDDPRAPGREAFAEAWTGWVGTQGQGSPFVRYFADKYGWESGGESPSAGFAKAEEEIILADSFTDEGAVLVESSQYKSDESIAGLVKHLQGKHDQSSHGRKGNGGAVSSAERAKAAQKTGAPTGLTAEDLIDINRHPEEYGFYSTAMDVAIANRSGVRPSDASAVKAQIKAVEDGLYVREVRDREAAMVDDEWTDAEADNAMDLYEMVRENGSVVVAMPPTAALNFVREGRYQTLFETGTSMGAVAYEARREEEFASHDLHPNVEPSKRTVYGFVSVNTPYSAAVRGYGDVRFELKPEVKERATMTDGDSLGSRATPIPMTGAPITRREAAGASLGWNSMEERMSRSKVKDPESVFSTANDLRYIEAQVHGGVSISDVARIYVRGSRPAPTDVNATTSTLYSLEYEAGQLGIPVVYQFD